MAVTPKNKDKRVRFTEPVTSSGNTIKKTASTSNLVFNKPMLSSTGVKPSTSASRSQPLGNTKKDKIQQTPRSANVQHSKLNVNSKLKCVKCNGCMLSDNVNAHRPTSWTFTIVGNACPLTRIITTTEVPLRKPTVLDNEIPKPVVTLGYSRKPRKSKTNVPVSKSKVVQIVLCCFIHNLEGVDLLTGSRDNNLYTLSLRDMMASSPISRHGLVRGLLKLKFEKDHLCSTCAMGNSKKKPHKPKSEDTNQEKLYLLHMDLCGPMCVASVTGKKYILVIIDDYSRFTWVKCLRIDNGTEFVNQTLREYYEKVVIFHETYVARSPQQNGVVERRNRTLIEAARTMLIYAKSSVILMGRSSCYRIVRIT
ncbi:retrovirus-related pol polyprotein from transposon TNT 1-94 [Tanacetum coccineum]